MIWKVKLRMGKISNFHDSIHFCYDPIHLIFILLKIQSILLDLDINLIYILYILWIVYPYSKSRFSKWIIQNIQSKFSVYIFG